MVLIKDLIMFFKKICESNKQLSVIKFCDEKMIHSETLKFFEN